MTSKLTKEQAQYLDTYLSLLEISKANIKKAKTAFLKVKEDYTKAKAIIDSSPSTSSIFRQIEGSYTSREQEFIIGGINPFYVFSEEVKKEYQDKILPDLARVYLGSLFESRPHSETYLVSLSFIDKFLNEANNLYIGNYLNIIEKELEDLKDPSVLLGNIDNALVDLPEVSTQLLYVSKVFNTLKALGGQIYSSSYNQIQKLPEFNVNFDFAKELSQLDSITLYTSIIVPLEQLKELNQYSKQDLENLAKLNAVRVVETKNLVEANKAKESLDKITDNLKGFEEGTLQEYIQNIIDNKEHEVSGETKTPFQHLLTDETNVDNVKANFNNIFEYIFTIDDRTVSLYNNPKYLQREEAELEKIARPNSNPYRADYYNSWFKDLDKLKGTNGSSVNITKQVEDLKKEISTDALNDNEISSINTKIDSILATVLTEIEPNIYSFYKALILFSNYLKDEESNRLLYEFLEVSLDPPIDMSSINFNYLEEIANKVKTDALTHIDYIVSMLITIKKDLIKQTIEDLLTSSFDPKALSTIDEIIARAKEYTEESKKLTEKVKEIQEIKLEGGVNSISNQIFSPYFNNLQIPGSSVYEKLSNNPDLVEKLGKLRAAKPHNYEPFAEIFVEEISDELAKVRVKAARTKADIFTSPQQGSAFNTLVAGVGINDKLRNIKIAIEYNDLQSFNKEKEKVLANLTEFHDKLLTYFLLIEAFNITNTVPKLYSDNNLYLKESPDYKYAAIQTLKFNSKELYERTIELHKAITELNILSKEALEEIEELKEEEVFSDIKDKVEKQNEEAAKKTDNLNLPKENWGIRISPATAFTRTVIQPTSTPTGEDGKELTKEEKANLPEVSTRENTKFGKSWYMMLLPTMTSNLPVTGGTQAPGAQPGLNFRIVNSLVKHKIPGFGPVYQPMGIDTINCTIVGCFTGADGTDKYKVGTVENFSEGAYNQSRDLFGLNGEIGNNGAGFLQEAVNKFDSFENFQGFYNEIIKSNKEIEVEINLKKNTNVLANGADGVFRDSTTGNPKFKGFIKRFDTYYVRDDRTWYILDVQLTTNDLTSKKCVNLTNIIAEATPDFIEEELQVKTLDDYKECLFQDTPVENSTGFPPRYKDKLRIETLSLKSIINSFEGVTLVHRTNPDEFLSISKHGYALRYTYIDQNVGADYTLVGTNPLNPIQTFREMGQNNWKASPSIYYGLALNTIAGFNFVASETDRRNLVGPVLKAQKETLPEPAITASGGRGFFGTIAVNTFGSIALQYNTKTGNLAEVETSNLKNEYDALESLKGVLKFDNITRGDFQREAQKYLDFLVALEAEGNYIEFKVDQATITCLDKPTEVKETNPPTSSSSEVEEKFEPLTDEEIEGLVQSKLIDNFKDSSIKQANTFYVSSSFLPNFKVDEEYIKKHIKIVLAAVPKREKDIVSILTEFKNTDQNFNSNDVFTFYAGPNSELETSFVQLTLSNNNPSKKYKIINMGLSEQGLEDLNNSQASANNKQFISSNNSNSVAANLVSTITPTLDPIS